MKRMFTIENFEVHRRITYIHTNVPFIVFKVNDQFILANYDDNLIPESLLAKKYTTPRGAMLAAKRYIDKNTISGVFCEPY